MASVVEFLKKKFANNSYNHKICEIIYQYCFSPNIVPAPFDKLKVYGYATVIRSNMGVIDEQIGDVFESKYDTEHILVLTNQITGKNFALLFPVIKSDNFESYLFRSQDYCFFDLEESDLEEQSAIIKNASGDEHLINIYDVDEDEEYMLSDLLHEVFTAFSKYCCDLRKRSNTIPDLGKLIDSFNEK